MAENEKVIKEKLKHSGLFSFKALYAFAHSWFVEADFGVTEDLYNEKIKGDSKEVEAKWTASKNASDYFKIEYGIKYRILNMSEVEVEIDGEKKKMNKGDLEMEVAGTLVRDKDSKFEKSAFNRFMRDIYNKYVIPSRVDQVKTEIREGATNFKEEIKAFLELSGKR